MFRCSLFVTGILTSFVWMAPARAGSLYFTVNEWDGGIGYVDLDALTVDYPIPYGLYGAYRIAVDPLGEKMYWTQPWTWEILCADLDGSNIQTIAVAQGGG